MSTIIAVKDPINKQTILATDTLATNSYMAVHRKNPKLFSLGCNMYAGCSGSYRLFQLLEYFCKVTDISYMKAKIESGTELEFLITHFVPHCIKIFEKKGLLCRRVVLKNGSSFSYLKEIKS